MMKNRINKPKVFLSHSKKDVEFIKRLSNDLPKCQIDYWLDEYEIRHGEPWLDAIFENGIPTCDSIIIYLTENSIESQLVKKEIDVGIIQKLKDNKISLLPYVSDSSLRSKLRSDIQALQVPEWNENNYLDLLPSVISEIWRSYLEGAVSNAVNKEKVKSLEYQLELQKIKDKTSGIFSATEETEFKYIYDNLNNWFEFFIEIYEKEENSNKEIFLYKKYFKLLILSIITPLSNTSNNTYENSTIKHFTHNYVLHLLNIDGANKIMKFGNFVDISEQLLIYGFLSRVHIEPDKDSPMWPRMLRNSGHFILKFTDKFERFRYWLTFYNLLPNKVELTEIVECS